MTNSSTENNDIKDGICSKAVCSMTIADRLTRSVKTGDNAICALVYKSLGKENKVFKIEEVRIDTGLVFSPMYFTALAFHSKHF